MTGADPRSGRVFSDPPSPKRHLGQHFLHDLGVLRAIVDALEVEPRETVVEIGPGTGRLTRRLAEAFGAERLLCVEQDEDMVRHLAASLPAVRVLRGDAASVDWGDRIGAQPAVVAGNLPYNAATAIYFNLLEHRLVFRRFVLMFQKEVADRLLAGPGSKKYGPPGIATTLVAAATRIRNVPPGAFRPRPKVDSSVVRFDPLPRPRFGLSEEDLPPLRQFLRTLFGQRRKTVANNLRAAIGGPGAAEHLEAVGIEPTARPESLDAEALVRLWRHVVGKPT